VAETEISYIIQIRFIYQRSCYGTCSCLTAKAGVPFWASPCEVCGGKNSTRTSFDIGISNFTCLGYSTNGLYWFSS